MTRKILLNPKAQFVQARNYTRLVPSPERQVSLVILHSIEADDKPSTAEAVAHWFAGPNAPKASAHACIDIDSVVECVRPNDVAWSANAANACSYNIEIAGWAKETEQNWMAHAFTLQQAAAQAQLACAEFSVPISLIGDDELADCLRNSAIMRNKMRGQLTITDGGVTTHVQVNRVLRQWRKYNLPAQDLRALSHSDPGISFPIEYVVNLAIDLDARSHGT